MLNINRVKRAIIIAHQFPKRGDRLLIKHKVLKDNAIVLEQLPSGRILLRWVFANAYGQQVNVKVAGFNPNKQSLAVTLFERWVKEYLTLTKIRDGSLFKGVSLIP